MAMFMLQAYPEAVEMTTLNKPELLEWKDEDVQNNGPVIPN